MTQVTIFRYLAKYIPSFIKIYGTIPMIKILRVKNAQAWVSMVFT